MAIANSAGKSPRTRSSVNQATASARSAWGSTPANCHSLRARRRSITGPHLPVEVRLHHGGHVVSGNVRSRAELARSCYAALLHYRALFPSLPLTGGRETVDLPDHSPVRPMPLIAAAP